MDGRPSRRDVIRALLAPLGGGLAGCQSVDDDATDTSTTRAAGSAQARSTTGPAASPTTSRGTGSPGGPGTDGPTDTTAPGSTPAETATPPAATPPDPAGTVVYRVNGGEATVDPVDDGPAWHPPDAVDGVEVGDLETYSVDRAIAVADGVPDTTPSGVFASEAWDETFAFSFDVTAGERYAVRVYLAEIFFEAAGERVIDVNVAGGEVELDDYDIHADAGRDTGVMRSFAVEATDGSLAVRFDGEVDNPKVSAIEVLRVEPRPGVLGAVPTSLDVGTVAVGATGTGTVTLRNRGTAPDDPEITVEDVSVAGTDATAFSHDSASATTIPPAETSEVEVSFAPGETGAHDAALRVTHSGTNAPLAVPLSGQGAPPETVQFSRATLAGFSASNPTALSVGPDGRVYVATLSGTVYAVTVARSGDGTYRATDVATIDAITAIPNHDDLGAYAPDVTDRHVTGLTTGGTPEEPVVYVSSSDPRLGAGTDTDDSDTNSGAISRLAPAWNDDGSLDGVDHEVLVIGLPRSELDHNTNGLALNPAGRTLYVAQGAPTNKGAPSDNFGHTPEYALSGAILSVDLDAVESNDPNSFADHDPGGGGTYPDLAYRYALPTLGETDPAHGEPDLPFGGDDGLNMATLVPDGPVAVHSPGYRNPYDLTLTAEGRVYTADNGPNEGWGGQPVDESGEIVAEDCTNRPNETGDFTTRDQLHIAAEGAYGGHPNPTRGNPEGAGLYDANGTKRLEFTASNTPVPFGMADPRQCDYRPPPGHGGKPGVDPGEDDGSLATFDATGGITEYPASNFGGAMRGDLLVVELYGRINRVQLDGPETVAEVTRPFDAGAGLGITAQGDADPFPGTVWTADYNPGTVTVFEPIDYQGDPL